MGGGVSVTDALWLPAPAREAILAHALHCWPEECCGLLAGDSATAVRFVYPLTNAEHSPVSFTIEPSEHYGALRHAERNEWELIGAFHSHPGGSARPSATDVERAAEPEWAWLIVSRGEIRGFRIAHRTVVEIEVVSA
jgi:proteasome lid subunit RPN8/RPN11